MPRKTVVQVDCDCCGRTNIQNDVPAPGYAVVRVTSGRDANAGDDPTQVEKEYVLCSRNSCDVAWAAKFASLGPALVAAHGKATGQHTLGPVTLQ